MMMASPGLASDPLQGRPEVPFLKGFLESLKKSFTLNDNSSASKKTAKGMQTDKSESLSLTGLSLEVHDAGNWDLNSSEIMQSGF